MPDSIETQTEVREEDLKDGIYMEVKEEPVYAN